MEMDREMEKFNRQLEADQRKWQAQQAREKAIDDMFDRLDQKIQLNRIEELEKERLNEERRIRENLEKRK